jgi:hypothetical protein
MLYTVQQNCELCENAFSEYQTVVYSFSKNKNKLQRPVFFGVLYYSKETHPYFIYHGFKTVPHLTVSVQKLQRNEGEEFYKEEDKWFVRQDEIFDANKQLEFFNQRLGSHVDITLPFTTVLIKNFTFMAVFALGLVILRYIRVIMLHPVVWFVVSMIVYAICTSGVVYSIIHNVPWFKLERDQFGNVFVAEYFMRGQRGQWAGEGYIFSLLCITAGLVLIFLSRVDRFFTKSQSTRIAVIGALVAVYFLSQLILTCYKFKSPWYGPGFAPPGHYQRGPLMLDQGNNI